MNNPKVRERIYMSRNKLQEIETDILNRRHVERYAMVRQWCKGSVLDISCGVGYGTFLISKNPDVTKICGVDIDQEAIEIYLYQIMLILFMTIGLCALLIGITF